MDRKKTTRPSRVLLAGATGTAGAAAARSLVGRGHELVCLVRPGGTAAPPAGATQREADVTDAAALVRQSFAGETFDAVVSCLASRTGAPDEAWAIDHRAQLNLLRAAKDAGVSHFVLLSAICVQKPRLAFQHAKLAFEAALIASGMTYSIVRPTAFFKSLSGQIGRVTRGRPFLLFGDGMQTACKPISDGDLGDFIAGCLEDPARRNRVLPIGGPGPAITPREQGEALFELAGMPPRFRQVPLRFFDLVGTGLDVLGRISPKLATKAELARIGRYYATESMLVWDDKAGKYDADATPETGRETLFAYYEKVLSGDIVIDRGDHTVF